MNERRIVREKPPRRSGRHRHTLDNADYGNSEWADSLCESVRTVDRLAQVVADGGRGRNLACRSRIGLFMLATARCPPTTRAGSGDSTQGLQIARCTSLSNSTPAAKTRLLGSTKGLHSDHDGRAYKIVTTAEGICGYKNGARVALHNDGRKIHWYRTRNIRATAWMDRRCNHSGVQ